jgi:PhnB protein
MKTNPIPQGYHTITPYLAVRGVPKLIDFLTKGFGAEVIKRHETPEGRVMNAEIRVGDSNLMLGEAHDGQEPRTAMLYMYVKDCDSVYKQAIKAGGKSVLEPMDHFYGDRSGAVDDPSGNQWWISTHIRDVTDEDMKKCMEESRKKK